MPIDSCGRAVLLGGVLSAIYGVPTDWLTKLSVMGEVENMFERLDSEISQGVLDTVAPVWCLAMGLTMGTSRFNRARRSEIMNTAKKLLLPITVLLVFLLAVSAVPPFYLVEGSANTFDYDFASKEQYVHVVAMVRAVYVGVGLMIALWIGCSVLRAGPGKAPKATDI